MTERNYARKRRKRKFKNFALRIVLIALLLSAAAMAAFMLSPGKLTGGVLNAVKEEKLKAFAEENAVNLSEYPQELLKLYMRNSETEKFVFEYPLKKDENFDIDLETESEDGNVPLYMQWDQRWGYKEYGLGMIALNGCGPVCLSMVTSYLTDNNRYDPLYMCEFSEDNGYYVPGNGTAWSLMSEGAEKLGLKAEELPLEESVVKDELDSGKPIICIMGEGDFTTEGHFIVLTDYKNGKVSVNDPNSFENSEKLWSFSKIKNQIRNLWSYSLQ